MRAGVTRIGPALDSRFAYVQVTAATGGEHGILDALSGTRSERLAIIELEANEDPIFLLQAAKYWPRVRKHLQQQDISRYGYFTDVNLQTNPPVVYLLAPALRFHPTTGSLLRYLHPHTESDQGGASGKLAPRIVRQ